MLHKEAKIITFSKNHNSKTQPLKPNCINQYFTIFSFKANYISLTSIKHQHLEVPQLLKMKIKIYQMPESWLVLWNAF